MLIWVCSSGDLTQTKYSLSVSRARVYERSNSIIKQLNGVIDAFCIDLF